MLDSLNPTQSEDILWDSAAIDEVVPARIHAVTEAFNAQGYQETLKPLHALKTRDKASGIEYVRLAKAHDAARMAVVHFNPFGNGLTDNMLLRAAYCNAAFRACGVTDPDGKQLSLITMAAPSGNKKIKLQRGHHRRIAKGQFDSLALQYLQIIKAMGYHHIAIVGFSQGASLAVAAAAVANQLGLTVTHLAIGEPANVVRRPKHLLARQFFASSKHLPAAVKAINMPSLHEAHRNEKPSAVTLNILRKIRLNYSLLSGLSLPGFEAELESVVLRQRIPVTLSYGGLTTISPPTAIRRIVERIRQQPAYVPHSLHVVEVAGGHHTWADSLNLLATFYTYGLRR